MLAASTSFEVKFSLALDHAKKSMHFDRRVVLIPCYDAAKFGSHHFIPVPVPTHRIGLNFPVMVNNFRPPILTALHELAHALTVSYDETQGKWVYLDNLSHGEIFHFNLIKLLEWYVKTFHITETDRRWINKDLSGWIFYSTLLTCAIFTSNSEAIHAR